MLQAPKAPLQAPEAPLLCRAKNSRVDTLNRCKLSVCTENQYGLTRFAQRGPYNSYFVVFLPLGSLNNAFLVVGDGFWVLDGLGMDFEGWMDCLSTCEGSVADFEGFRE